MTFPPNCVSLQTDFYYEYTECDSTGSRWRVAIPQIPGDCVGLPEPVRGTECSKRLSSFIGRLEFKTSLEPVGMRFRYTLSVSEFPPQAAVVTNADILFSQTHLKWL